MKKTAMAALIFCAFVTAPGAEVNFDGKPFSLAGELGAELFLPAPEAGKAARPGKEWTIMVFVNGKNDLEEFALKDMNEMEQVGSTDKVNVVAEVGRIKGYDSSDGDWKTVRRYLVQKDADVSRVTSPVLAEFPGADMGDYRRVIAFGKWAKTAYPAKKYMLIIWNHGSGWEKGLKARTEKGISYDEESGNHLTTPQLGLALKEIGGVDVYGSDACLMQMAEVAYELKDHAEFIVGSEETEPADGYSYNNFLSPVAADPAMSAEALAKLAVDAYADHYADVKEGSTQSYVRTSALAGFLAACDAFTAAVRKAGEKDLANKAMAFAQSYSYAENKDLYHFVKLILAETRSEDVKAKGQALQAYITGKLVGHNRTSDGYGGWTGPGANYANSHGIAVYLPGTAAPAAYAELAWARQSAWDEFIDWLAVP